jgi:hypothetical protein
MEKKLYHISDELQALIDWDNVMSMPRYAGGHDEQMKGLFKGAKVVAHWNQGDYQGTVATCVKLPDGRFLAYNDYYGSCSGCDSWDGATDIEVKKLCIDLANGAYIFDSLNDVVTFLSQEEFDSYEWRECAKPLLERIKVWCFICSLERIGFKQRKDSFSYLYQHKPFLFELEFDNNNPMFVNSHVYTIGEKPDATIKLALPDLSTHVLDFETIDYLLNVFECTLKRLCEVAIAKSRNDMKHSALAKIMSKL